MRFLLALTIAAISCLGLVGCVSNGPQTVKTEELVSKGCEANQRAPESGEALSYFNQAATKDERYRELVRSLSSYRSQMTIVKAYIASNTYDKTFALGLLSKASEEKAVIDSFCLGK